jgi:hypothetical protein
LLVPPRTGFQLPVNRGVANAQPQRRPSQRVPLPVAPLYTVPRQPIASTRLWRVSDRVLLVNCPDVAKNDSMQVNLTLVLRKEAFENEQRP